MFQIYVCIIEIRQAYVRYRLRDVGRDDIRLHTEIEVSIDDIHQLDVGLAAR